MPLYKQDHIHVTNPDPQKTAKFYTEVMGAKVTREHRTDRGEMIDLDLGGIPLRISASTGADDNWKGLQHGLHHLGLTVDDLDKAAEEMKLAGVKFIIKPFSPRPGYKVAFICTPDGVLIELMENKES
ncbi:VOC family protein [Chloroflexota bacterium]